MRLASSRPDLFTMQRHSVANQLKLVCGKLYRVSYCSLRLYTVGRVEGDSKEKHMFSQDGSMFVKQRPNSLLCVGKTRLFEALILTRHHVASLGTQFIDMPLLVIVEEEALQAWVREVGQKAT